MYKNCTLLYFIAILACTNPKPLGMESKKIPDSRITASSVWDVNHAASNARLNFRHKSGSWSSRRNDQHQWLQVDFKYKATITHIIIQGRSRHHQWVRSYIVSYSKDGAKFRYYRKNKRIKVGIVFIGFFMYTTRVLCSYTTLSMIDLIRT